MLESILAYMRCPRCSGTCLRSEASGLSCPKCSSQYPVCEGILDMLADESSEVITPFQRVMQSGFVVSIYERLWRPLGYYLASSRSFEEEIRTVLRFVQGRGEGRILDLACGTGVFTRQLARQGEGMVVGLDLSLPMLRRARRLADEDGLQNVLLIRGSAFRLPFIAAAFPYINCCGALHLFDHPDLALREIDRVLSAAGHLCVQTTIRPGHSMGVAFILERVIRFGFFEEVNLRERIRLAGFKILQTERHRISYTFLARHIS